MLLSLWLLVVKKKKHQPLLQHRSSLLHPNLRLMPLPLLPPLLLMQLLLLVAPLLVPLAPLAMWWLTPPRPVVTMPPRRPLMLPMLRSRSKFQRQL